MKMVALFMLLSRKNTVKPAR